MGRNWKRSPRLKVRLNDVIKATPLKVKIETRKALSKSGNEAVRIIKGDVPVDQGNVKRSVRWTFGDPPKWIRGSTDVRRSRVPSDMRISIFAGGPGAHHAHLVHNGTGLRTRKDGTSTGIMPPQPFFWPNIRSLRRRQRGRITRGARKGLKKALS